MRIQLRNDEGEGVKVMGNGAILYMLFKVELTICADVLDVECGGQREQEETIKLSGN